MTMTVLGKRVVIVFCFLTCCLLTAQAEKWRAIAKKIQRCDGAERPIELRNLNLTYSHKGELFDIAVIVDVQQEVTLTVIKVTLFSMSGTRPVKYLFFEYKDPCKTIEKGHPYVEPLFTSGEVPRVCHFLVGKYPAKEIHYDLHGVIIGGNFRGDYILQVDVYAGDLQVFCQNVYGVIKKDTLH